ncbi:MAG: hypothetical protein OHK0056_30300 [Bacteriovoracaceae bacterium]
MAIPSAKKVERLLFYVGTDDAYWKTIFNQYQNIYQSFGFTQKIFREKDPVRLQSLALTILNEVPSIIYLDFSTNREPMLALAQLLTRDNILSSIPVVGLVENKEHVKQCLSAGVDFIHVKCGEYHDVIYDPMVLAFPKEVIKPQFALAKFKKDIFLIDDFRVGYISPTSLHVEGNLKLEKDSVIELETSLPKNIVSSKKFKVRSITEQNLYYDFKYAYDLEIQVLDEPSMTEDEFDDALGAADEAEKAKLAKKAQLARKQKMLDYEENLKRAKKQLRSWVQDNVTMSAPKSTKVLMVDRQLRFLLETDIKALDQYPYSIRCQTVLSDTFREIIQVMPGIIAIELFSHIELEDLEIFNQAVQILIEKKDDLPTEGATPEEQAKLDMIKNLPGEESEELSAIAELIKFIKGIDGYNPFILIFNCPFKTTKAIQESFQYPLLMANKDHISMGSVLNITEIYEKKQSEKYNAKMAAKVAELKKADPQKYRNLTVDSFNELRYYVKKSSPQSYCSFHYPVVINSISESELTFLSSELLELKTYRLEYPVPMSIHLVPSDGKAYVDIEGKKQYRALVHSIDEQDKKLLRRYVNEIFLAPKMEKQAKEDQAYWDRHQKIIQEREEAIKAEQEANAAAANELLSKTRIEGEEE